MIRGRGPDFTAAFDWNVGCFAEGLTLTRGRGRNR